MPEHAPRTQARVLLQIIICTPSRAYTYADFGSAILLLVFIWGYGSAHYPGKAIELVFSRSICEGFAVLFLGPIERQGGEAGALPPSYTPARPAGLCLSGFIFICPVPLQCLE